MTKTKTNQDLWINSLGEVGRGEELVRYPSSDQVHDLFGGKPPTADQVEALWDVIIRSFLRVDITDRTAADIRRLANELANALSYAQDLSGVDVKS